MAKRRTFIRAGGLFAAGAAITAATPLAVAHAVGDDDPVRRPLLTWHAALANRRYAPAVIATIGSSTSEGVGVSAYGRSYAHLLVENLRSRFPVPGSHGGDNYVAAWGVPGEHRDYAWPVVRTGGVPSTTGWGLKAVNLNAPGQRLSYTFTGTGVQIWYSRFAGGGSFSVTVNGTVVAAAVETAGPTDRNAVWSSGPLVRGTHTVVVTCRTTGSSSATFVHGFAAFDGDESQGIRLYHGGHGGTTSGTFAANLAGWAPRLATIQPHLVVLQLGVNDWRAGIAAAVLKSHLRSVIAAVRAGTRTDPSFVVYGSPRIAAGHAVEDFTAVTDAWRSLADEDPSVAYFDLGSRQPSPVLDNTAALYTPDLIHTTDRGAAHTADALAAFLSPG
ncbi:GDSL-type esterase/lipase family protein [Actinoplanes sp. NPDC051851]|uniref:GDSL-type esterase/lipase family protein n=1 Tax=Actinoplanes sp. NPDC051851 TaxID=3154753 RepID=UPI00343F4B42